MSEKSKSYLFIINNAPYGDERLYRSGCPTQTRRDPISVPLQMAFCARKGQKTPDGYYNIERMVKALALRGGVAT
jgi:uncharacterized protein involved in oxidation of intracellular sulfur